MQNEIASKKQSTNVGAKELEKIVSEREQATVERDRLQQQLEMLVTELEKSQVFNKLTKFIWSNIRLDIFSL